MKSKYMQDKIVEKGVYVLNVIAVIGLSILVVMVYSGLLNNLLN